MPVRNIPRYAFHFGLLQVLSGTYWGGNQWPDGLTVSIRIWAQPRLPDIHQQRTPVAGRQHLQRHPRRHCCSQFSIRIRGPHWGMMGNEYYRGHGGLIHTYHLTAHPGCQPPEKRTPVMFLLPYSRSPWERTRLFTPSDNHGNAPFVLGFACAHCSAPTDSITTPWPTAEDNPTVSHWK